MVVELVIIKHLSITDRPQTNNHKYM